MSAPTVGADGQLYTRGGPNVPDNRGLSMVEKHLEKLQQEKEAKGLEKLKVLMPTLGPAVLSLALMECGCDVDRTVVLLRRFQVAKVKELSGLHKELKRHELEKAKREREHGASSGSDADARKKGGNDSGSSSSDDSSGSSESDSEDERQRRRREKKRGGSKKRRRSRSASPKGGGSGKKGRREKERGKRKEKGKREKERREKKAKAKDSGRIKGVVKQEEYGKYGIIREADMYAKRPEFQMWAAEVKKVDIELMPKFEEKELFKEYMEEFNTASFPSKKFYDVDLYERRRALKAAKKGLPTGPVERTVFDDETELKRQRAAQRAQDQQERLQQAYEELVHSDKAADMREQEMLRMKMGLAYRTGNVEEARKIAEKLKPDEL